MKQFRAVKNPSLPFKTKKLYNYSQPWRQLRIELSDLSRTNWRLIESETDQRKPQGPRGQ